jgi:hypothetical protein
VEEFHYLQPTSFQRRFSKAPNAKLVFQKFRSRAWASDKRRLKKVADDGMRKPDTFVKLEMDVRWTLASKVKGLFSETQIAESAITLNAVVAEIPKPTNTDHQSTFNDCLPLLR